MKAWGEEVELLILHAYSWDQPHANDAKGKWEGIPFTFFSGSHRRPKKGFGKFWDSLKAMIASTFYVLKHGSSYDVFYLYSPKLFQVFHLYILFKLLRVPLVVEMAERYSAYYEGEKQTFKGAALKYLHRLHERSLTRLCSHLVVISTQLYKYFSRYFSPDRLSLVPINVEVERFKGQRPYQAAFKRIGYLGSFGSKDGVPGIVEAFERVKPKVQDLRLRLIGLTPVNTRNKWLQKSMDSPFVEYTGLIPYKAIPDQLAACDLLIVNRPDNPYAQHGLPTKLGEYLASGAPVIASDVGDIGRYLTHQENIILVPADDPDALADAINKRYRYYTCHSKVGLAGVEISKQQFDYKQQSKQLCEMLYRTLGKPIPETLDKPERAAQPGYESTIESRELANF